MKWFGNLKTATKIVAGFMIVALLLGGFGLYSVSALGKMKNNMDGMYDNNLTSVRELSGAQGDFQNLRVLIRDMSTEEDSAIIAKYEQDIQTARQKTSEKIDNFRPLATTPPRAGVSSHFGQRNGGV